MMKYFGTVKSFDNGNGNGEISPETGGDNIKFDRSAFTWQNDSVPVVGQRLSYDVGMRSGDRMRCAENLETI